ncbi:MAG TPA: glycosyltransferase family 2 protein [Candidatus Limnocylindria bacterium]|nr:glycosyltransferase family 2 protein [Candidatus Limnocylindria bacterium]
MRARAISAVFLLVAAAVAWLTVTEPLAARVLQAGVAASLVYVAWLAWRGSRLMRAAFRAARHPTGERMDAGGQLPPVTLVVPAWNEASVIAETVAHLASFAYAGEDGRPRYDVLVVDDGSTDDTGALARSAASSAPHVQVMRREPQRDAPRTKGAVLAWAMDGVQGEVVGVVDADTRVGPSFLQDAMLAWRGDPTAAALQVARRPHNAHRSWLTAAQAEEQLMDLASQCGRRAVDGTAELRGNGMFVRVAALEAVGGWDATALTEDLELSTRLAIAGEHVALAPHVAIGEEAIESIPPLWHQRVRWAEGSLRRLIQHAPAMLSGSQPLSRKADFLAFAAEFLLPPLFATTTLASLVTVVMPQPADWTVPVSLALGYGLGVFLLALGGLSAVGVRGLSLVGRAGRGSLFLSHWLLVVPWALVRILAGPGEGHFRSTPRFTPTTP